MYFLHLYNSINHSRKTATFNVNCTFFVFLNSHLLQIKKSKRFSITVDWINELIQSTSALTSFFYRVEQIDNWTLMWTRKKRIHPPPGCKNCCLLLFPHPSSKILLILHDSTRWEEKISYSVNGIGTTTGINDVPSWWFVLFNFQIFTPPLIWLIIFRLNGVNIFKRQFFMLNWFVKASW